MLTRSTFVVALLALFVLCPPAPAQVKSGDVLPFTLRGSGLDPAHTVEVEGASFLRIHFESIALEPGARLEIGDAHGRIIQTYEGGDRTDEWSKVVYTQPAIVTLRGALSDRSRFAVDSVVRGIQGFGLEAACAAAACGVNIACQPAGLQTFKNRRAVARFHYMVNQVAFVCTAWMVGDPDCLITNQHCIAGVAVGTMMAEFNYECDQCANGDCVATNMFGINKVLESSVNLDWALLETNGAPGVGILPVSSSAPLVGRPMYVIHHSAGGKKGISFGDSTAINPPGPVPCGTQIAVSYTALVTGGASGSPAFCKSTDRVEALIHCGNQNNCDNCAGVPMSAIVPLITPIMDQEGCTYDIQAAVCGLGAGVAPNTSTIKITGSAVTQNTLTLAFHNPPAANCDVYFDCNAKGIICFAQVVCQPNDTAATVAKNLAAAINAPGSTCANAGFSALAISNHVSVTGPVGTELECCLSSAPEMANCGGAGLSWLPIGPGCDVNNVCSTINCNEEEASTGVGLDFSKSHPQNFCTAGVSSSGCVAEISAVGIPSASAPSGFVVTTTHVEGAKSGLYFYGQSGQQANPWGNGSSFQCVIPPVRRGGLLPSFGTSGSCDGLFVQDLNSRWCPACPKPAHAPSPGLPIQVQLWYRDPANTSNQTTSLSGGITADVIP